MDVIYDFSTKNAVHNPKSDAYIMYLKFLTRYGVSINKLLFAGDIVV